MHELYLSLQARSSLPTPFEVLIATASPGISEADVSHHLKSLKIVLASSGIQSTFEKQVSVSTYYFRYSSSDTWLISV